MELNPTDLSYAQEMDQQDKLAHFRSQFVISEPDTIYLDGNSLGRLPASTMPLLQKVIEQQWGERLIRSWNEGWIDTQARLGAKIAGLIGAQPDEVLVADSTSLNLFKLATAALRARTGRTTVISDEFNFPSDLYILQGVIDLLGKQHKLQIIRSKDGLTIDPRAVHDSLDEHTALLSLTHVAFKSAYMYDMVRITEMAQQTGAWMLWDLSHSVGAVPLDLNGCNVDLAIGCTYKYLNGGPGAPAFLYVRRDLQAQLLQPVWGWFAAKHPFDFDLQFEAAPDIGRYKVGSPPMLSMLAIEPALALFEQAGMGLIREKSVQQTEYLIHLAEQWLLPLGFSLGSPRQPELRGSHVSLRHPEAYRINRALIEAEAPAPRVIPDFRAPDNIRLGITPLYTTYVEIWRAMQCMRQVTDERLYERFPNERLPVT